VSGEDWERIKVIFEEALELPERERMGYLASACGSDANLSAVLVRLLENHLEQSSSGSTIVKGRVFEDGALIAGRLRITRFIAGGGMGEVYEVFDERLRTRLALKTLRLELTSTEDALSRFQREILIAREVSHPNLCSVFDFIEHHVIDRQTGESSVVPCLTMELIDGESLADHLARERPFSPTTALPLIRQAAAGLELLHDHGIVHRDLKPSNIMLAKDRQGAIRVVLMDFGLAKRAHRKDEMFESRLDVHAGAPYFMAPELLRESGPSVASDIYSFGLLIDEMVTSDRAFSAQSLQSLYFAKLWEAPIAPSLRSAGLPQNWEATILRCLRSDPGERFQRVTDVLAALEHASDVEICPVSNKNQLVPPAPPSTKPPPVRRQLRRRTLVSGFAVLSILGTGRVLISLPPNSISTSIQVYDIENTASASYNYLCKGTSVELIRRLSRVKGMSVIPMHEPRSLARESKVGRFTLEGILQEHKEKLRLSLLVTDNQDSKVVYSEDFDRQKIDDPLQLQSDIAAGTALALEKHIRPGSVGLRVQQSSLFPILSRLTGGFFRPLSQDLQSSPTSNTEAFDLYLRGHQLLEDFSSSSNQAAISYLQRAVKADPAFALGYATLADAYLNMMNYYQMPQKDLLEDARKNAEMAVNLDSDLAEAQDSLAVVRQTDWDWHGAERCFLEAIRLKPSYAIARRRYAGLLLQFDRFDEAISMAREAYSQDPYDRGAAPGIGLYFYLAGHYDEAIRFLEGEIGDGDMTAARHNLGDAYAEEAVRSTGSRREDYFAKAFLQAAKVSRIEKKEDFEKGRYAPFGDEMFAHYYSLQSNYAAARPYVERMLTDLESNRVSPAIMAWIFAVQGDKERALDLLERALATRDRKLFYVKQFPALASLRGEPRFKTLVANMGL